jgi:hypothetical protein
MDGKDDELTYSAASPPRADASPTAPVPSAFVIVTFAVALLVAGLIAYYGFTGRLGSGIP